MTPAWWIVEMAILGFLQVRPGSMITGIEKSLTVTVEIFSGGGEQAAIRRHRP
jgi:hypothetical protein